MVAITVTVTLMRILMPCLPHRRRRHWHCRVIYPLIACFCTLMFHKVVWAAYAGSGWIFNNQCTAKMPRNLTVKKYNYVREFVATLFWTHPVWKCDIGINRPHASSTACWRCGLTVADHIANRQSLLFCSFSRKSFLVSTRSTQPCIPPGSLNRVPASAGVRAGMSPLRVAGNTVWSHVACEFP